MNRKAEASSFSVYLGGGLYIGRAVSADGVAADSALVEGHTDNSAMVIVRAETAANYGRKVAINVCHVARHCGLAAWIVRHPEVSA